jgi:hypothetical protein
MISPTRGHERNQMKVGSHAVDRQSIRSDISSFKTLVKRKDWVAGYRHGNINALEKGYFADLIFDVSRIL